MKLSAAGPFRILLLGGSGLIGSFVRKELIRRNIDFVAPSSKEFDLTQLALSDPRTWPQASNIIYVAQNRRYRSFPEAGFDTIQVNAFAPIALLNHYSARGLRSFIYASSGNVYWSGRRESREINEFPNGDVYSASKIAAEELLIPWRDVSPLGIVRIFTAYGPGSAPETMVASLRDRIRADEPITLSGPEGDVFQPTYAGDVAQCLVNASLAQWTGAADVAGPERLSIRQMSDRLATQIGAEATFVVGDVEPQNFGSRGVPLKRDFWPDQHVSFPGPHQ